MCKKILVFAIQIGGVVVVRFVDLILNLSSDVCGFSPPQQCSIAKAVFSSDTTFVAVR